MGWTSKESRVKFLAGVKGLCIKHLTMVAIGNLLTIIMKGIVIMATIIVMIK
jgi:hypothetical protein